LTLGKSPGAHFFPAIWLAEKRKLDFAVKYLCKPFFPFPNHVKSYDNPKYSNFLFFVFHDSEFSKAMGR